MLPNNFRTAASTAQQKYSRKKPRSALNHTCSLCNNLLEIVWFLLVEPCAVPPQISFPLGLSPSPFPQVAPGCGDEAPVGLTQVLEEEAVTCCFAELGSLLSSRVCLL